MKKVTLLAFGLLCGSLVAQNNHKWCSHGDVMEEAFKQDPEAKIRIEKMNKEYAEADKKAFKEGYDKFRNGLFQNDASKQTNPNQTQGVVYTIPVVFHILHQGGSEMITPAQVKDAVAILNRDYNKQNADTSVVIPDFQSIIGDVEFNFVLASKDPNGNCTNGIIYHNDPMTDWTSGTTGPYTGTAAGKWNPTKYLNIYTVNSISSGAAGYTYLPGTWGTGNGKDCIIILHDYVGSIGTSSTLHSRALTHEVGHWFNLPHVWGGTNAPGVACGDEGVTDTPETMGYDYCPPSAASSQICNSGVSENYQNYMDYSYCSVMFTAGQATRMRTAITSSTSGRSTLWSATNLTNTGVSNPQPCIPVAGFGVVSNEQYVCAGNTVQFQDSTWNTTVTGWNWSFPGGTPSASIDSMPIITYSTPGLYSVSYTATTSAGSGNVTKTNLIHVGNSTAVNQTSLIEGFESITVPNSDWTIDNATGPGWVQTATAAATGTSSMMVNNFTNSAGEVEVLYTPSYNLANINATSPGATFTFKVAHQRKSTSSSDKLQVFSSTNCGYTWQQRYSKSGSSLATVTGANTSAFTPSGSSQWRTETVSISAMAAQTNVWFKFVLTADANGSSNNVFIDDINISNNGVGIEDIQSSALNFVVYPNPTKGLSNVEFTLDNASDVKVELIDMLGRVVEEHSGNKLPEGAYKYSFGKNVSQNSGVYFIKLIVNGKSYAKKLVIE